MKNNNRKNEQGQIEPYFKIHFYQDSETDKYFPSRNFLTFETSADGHGFFINPLRTLRIDLLHPQ